jgi:YfiH family protein
VNRFESQSLKAEAIVHGFFGRQGGVSAGIYASLNCGQGSKDDAQSVAQNRHLVVAALAQDCQLVSLAQIHSAIVHTLPAWQAGQDGSGRLEGDGMVSATPGLMLGILTADCAPVLFVDAQAKVIGAAHAGWKGALGQNGYGVLEAVLEAMQRLGALRDRVAAVIGPCISQANYEVGGEFRDRFLEFGVKNRRYFIASDQENRYRFDLPAYVADRLIAAGTGSVETLGVCTYPPENGFFSFRRSTHAGQADYGRQISAIALTG